MSSLLNFAAISHNLQFLILDKLKCNGEFNCADGSDELDCPVSTQSCNNTNYFACKTSGFCIPLSWKCDGNFGENELYDIKD